MSVRQGSLALRSALFIKFEDALNFSPLSKNRHDILDLPWQYDSEPSVTNKKTPVKGAYFIGDAMLAIYELKISMSLKTF